MAISEELVKKWNRKVDKNSIDNVKSMENNGGSNFEELEVGTYPVEIEKLELVSSKKGDPMLSCWLKVLEGEYKGRKMFINQLVNKDFQIRKVNDILRGILSDTDLTIKVEWNGDYGEYRKMIEDIFFAVKDAFTYDVEFTKDKKGYNVYQFLGTYDK